MAGREELWQDVREELRQVVLQWGAREDEPVGEW